ncbi:hypothetical protein PSHT_10047 [Puccinia striiformis]|uniref:40S ribosomal protein S8 n=1 Tax=Puccinia striiformis TaxID=27350 RepID=A0A2S4VCB9_9BASI|nr:hypothetical protein PSHT_10047 [Puccinia striiformis]
MSISRDSRHKRSATGAKRAQYRKKRKFELGRQPAMTKLGAKRIHTVGSWWQHQVPCLETRGWKLLVGSERITRKTRVIGVVYTHQQRACPNQHPRQGAIIQIDATPFRQCLPRLKNGEPAKEKSKTVLHKLEQRRLTGKVDTMLETQFQAGRLYASISSRPGQSGRCDGYVLEGKELEFYLRRLKSSKQNTR